MLRTLGSALSQEAKFRMSPVKGKMGVSLQVCQLFESMDCSQILAMNFLNSSIFILGGVIFFCFHMHSREILEAYSGQLEAGRQVSSSQDSY